MIDKQTTNSKNEIKRIKKQEKNLEKRKKNTRALKTGNQN